MYFQRFYLLDTAGRTHVILEIAFMSVSPGVSYFWLRSLAALGPVQPWCE